MRKQLASLALLAGIAFASPAHAQAGTVCKDGTKSSAAGKGACSGHGGVAPAAASAAKAPAKSQPAAPLVTASGAPKTVAPKSAPAAKTNVPATPAKTAAAPAAAKSNAPAKTASKSVDSDPADATAQCKDGTYSHAKTHQGACSRHGGVAKFLK